MITIRKSEERGRGFHGWLDSRHTFSFADYYDPQHMGFRALRVINEDQVAGGGGFPTHPHRDMEIISYVIEGALEHKDSMGTGSVIRPGEVQRMTAGTGVAHSEYNHSQSDDVKFLQIWILPDRRGHEPSYEQKAFSEAERTGQLKLVASPDGRDGSVTVHQDVCLYSSLLEAGSKIKFESDPGRHLWLQVVEGELSVNGNAVSAGDGAGISKESLVNLESSKGAHILLFDLA